MDGMKEMNKDGYLKEVESRLLRMFKGAKEGHKAHAIERHRLEGFMQAGVFLDLTSNDELSSIMEQKHVEVFGMSISERESEMQEGWKGVKKMDYSYFDKPTFERKSQIPDAD
jgi:hypothetical protein